MSGGGAGSCKRRRYANSLSVPSDAKREKRGLVIFFHGNAGNIGHRLDYLRMFHDLGLATLIIDYRGYGLSGGKSPWRTGAGLDLHLGTRHGGRTVSPAADPTARPYPV